MLEHKRLEGLIRDAEGLQAAKRNAIAFFNPKDLQDERAELLSKMGVLPMVSDAIERGRKMLKDLQQIDQRRAEAEESGDKSIVASSPD